MLVGSVIIAVLIAALVVALYAALDAMAGALQAARDRSAALERQRQTDEELKLAVRIFRHDLANVLGLATLRGSLAEYLVSRGSVAEAQRVVAQLQAALADGSALLDAFDLEVAPRTDVALDQLGEHLALQFGDATHAVRLAPDLAGWTERAPAVTLTVLLGNLIKNALEAADAVDLRREGRTLVVRNRIAEADRALLADEQLYAPGASTKGRGRGLGLASARLAARQCRATLRHEVIEAPGGPEVEFRLTFGASLELSLVPASERSGPQQALVPR